MHGLPRGRRAFESEQHANEPTGERVDLPRRSVVAAFGAAGRVTGLDTARGPIEAETVVLATGLWTSELARLAEEKALSPSTEEKVPEQEKIPEQILYYGGSD